MLISLLIAAQVATLSLPDQLNIPDGHSTVICPTLETAKTMVTRHYRVKPAPNNNVIDTDQFFAGIKATGCSQDSPSRKGEVIIQSVVSRTKLSLADGEERVIVYQGINKVDDSPSIGIVDEDSNNGYARTKLAEWMIGRTSDGWLDARNNDGGTMIFYCCGMPAQAKAVVEKLSGMKNSPPKNFTASLQKQATAQQCRPASDRYYVTQILGARRKCLRRGMLCRPDGVGGNRPVGMRVGLIFDASLM